MTHRIGIFLSPIVWFGFFISTSLLSPVTAAAQSGVPAVTGVSIASSPASGSSYATGENIDVAVTFSRAVTVTGSPRLALTVGSRTRQAAFRSASGSTVNFRYTVVGGDRDANGISIAADALTLNGGGIKAGSADAALGLGSHALGDQSDHRVDGGGPTFDGVASPALSFTRGTQGSFTLPAATTGSATYALAATPALPAGLAFNFGTRTLSGTPEVGMAKTTYTLNAYRLVPFPGEEGVFYEQLADTLAFTVAVSGAVPAVSGVEIASSPADGSSYATGEYINVYVTFNYPVAVTGVPELALGLGAATRQAEYIPTSGDGSRLRFRYRVTASDFDGDGISIAAGGPDGRPPVPRHGLERRRRSRSRQPCDRDRRRPHGERSPALLRGDGGEPALDRRHGREPATARGQRRRRHGELRADRAGCGDDAEPAAGPLLDRRHAHDLGHARRRRGSGHLHLDGDRRRRRHRAAFVRHHGGPRPTRRSRRVWRCPRPRDSTATTPRGRSSGRSSRSTRTSP